MPRFLSQRSEHQATQKQSPRQMASRHMQQAVQLLTMPAQELALAVADELETNPLLDYEDEWEDETDLDELLLEASELDTEEPVDELDTPLETDVTFDDNDFHLMASLDQEFQDLFALSDTYRPERQAKDTYQEGRIKVAESLYEYLMRQARDTFENAEELRMAEYIIGNLDENGFLSVHLLEIAVAHRVDAFKLRKVQMEVQSFLPAGVAADDTQESLLLQLIRRSKHGTLAWNIIAYHYDDLINNRLSTIQREQEIDADTLQATIDQEITPLDPHPGLTYARQYDTYITPDILISEVGDHLQAEVNLSELPSLKMNRRYLHMMQHKELPPDAQDFLKAKFRAGRWLINTIRERNQTITRIAEALLQKQIAFFSNPEGKLKPLTMKQLAKELHLHESTISRVVANKYLSSPRGTFALRHFFSGETITKHGESLSTRSIKDCIQQLIDAEDRRKPLSDNQIAKTLKQQGIDCARRTVAKYRTELRIPPVKQRRQT